MPGRAGRGLDPFKSGRQIADGPVKRLMLASRQKILFNRVLMRHAVCRQFFAYLMLVVFVTTGMGSGLRPVLCVNEQMNHFAIEAAHLATDCCGELDTRKAAQAESQEASFAAPPPGCVDIPLIGESLASRAETIKKAAGFEGTGFWALAPPSLSILASSAGEPLPSLFSADDIPDARLIQHRSVVLHI